MSKAGCTKVQKVILAEYRSLLTTNFSNETSHRNALATSLLDYYQTKKGVKVIATDFDLTMITQHSGGMFDRRAASRDGKPDFLIAPDFNHFIHAAFLRGIQIVIVSFSDRLSAELANRDYVNRLLNKDKDKNSITPAESQAISPYISGQDLIEHVMRQNNPAFAIQKVYGYLPSNYVTAPFYASVGLDQKMPNDKTYHLSQVYKEFKLKPSEVLYIDDDQRSCRIMACEADPPHVIHVPGESGFCYNSISPLEKC